jgi:hypothetical protein
MMALVDKALRRHFAAGPVAETDAFRVDGINRLRRKGMVRSERVPGDYGRWKHELTPAGIAARDRILEVSHG